MDPQLTQWQDVLELLRTKVDMMEEHSYYFPGSFKGKVLREGTHATEHSSHLMQEEYLEYVEAQTAFFQGRLRSLEKVF